MSILAALILTDASTLSANLSGTISGIRLSATPSPPAYNQVRRGQDRTGSATASPTAAIAALRWSGEPGEPVR
jgi:hypothetical protein